MKRSLMNLVGWAVILMFAVIFPVLGLISQSHQVEDPLETTHKACSYDFEGTEEVPLAALLPQLEVSEDTEVSEVQSTPESQASSPEEIYLREYDYIPMTDDLKLHIKRLCDYYNFEPRAIYQLIYSESRYTTTADNGICRGLMQLMYIEGPSDYFSQMEDVYNVPRDYDLFDPYINTTLGIRVLSEWRRVSDESSTMSDWINSYGWGYDSEGVTYGDYVLSIDLESIDFSSYEVIG